MDWSQRKVLIIGAARQGTALARYLVGQGARVVLNDRRPAEAMTAAREALADLRLEWVLGGHPLGVLEGVDLVCLSGGVPLDLPLVQEAVRRGIPLSNDSQIFLEQAPCRVIGITGSAGKSTTTALVGHIAQGALAGSRPEAHSQTAGGPRVWVGGNLGRPLIAAVKGMGAEDLAVMELSSFQLELMSRSPEIAAVLNLSPNHLDRHRTMEAYTAAKARILMYQTGDAVAVLGRDDPGAWALAGRVHGRLLSFGRSHLPEGQEGTYLDGETIGLRLGGRDRPLIARPEVRLRGDHNLSNVLAACLLAAAAQLPDDAIRSGVASFESLPHRLEFVRSWRGADWYNDSIATAPERAMAAVQAFERPLILLVGGRDKDLPWDAFGGLVRKRVDHVVVFGEAADKVMAAVGTPGANGRLVSVRRCETLHQAVQEAAGLARPGYVVLLAPGGTSFDEFQDFEERGERYKQWVNELS